tara:strand:- start:306 stop:410 length:105 start_codon:yes stop_codon:yes gene_type:complete
MTETKKTKKKEEKEVYTNPETGSKTYKDGSPWDQ